jgi:hypothetical protein
MSPQEDPYKVCKIKGVLKKDRQTPFLFLSKSTPI